MRRKKKKERKKEKGKKAEVEFSPSLSSSCRRRRINAPLSFIFSLPSLPSFFTFCDTSQLA